MFRKKCSILCVLLLAVVLIAGCASRSSMAYTYNVETGDSVRIELNTKDGYSMTSSMPFSISKDGEDLMQGSFMNEDGYDLYWDAVSNDPNAKNIQEGTTPEGNKYFSWNFKDQEFNYCVQVNGGKCGIILGCIVSPEVSKECFSRLSITIGDK